MALYTPWTLNQIRTSVRRELLDPTGKWWSNDELNQYINDWQNTLQTQFEFVWSTSTLTLTDTTTQFYINTTTIQITSSSFIIIGGVAQGALRLDGVWYTNGGTDTATGRLSPRSMADLDTFQRNWRGTEAAAGIPPIIVYQENYQTVSFWPPPNGSGTVFFEYPVLLTITSGTSTMQIPPWTRYSVLSYCTWRAYSRFGPNQDINKAVRRRRSWERQLRMFRKFYDGYFPDKAEMLRPGRKWAGQILRTKPAWPVWR